MTAEELCRNLAPCGACKGYGVITLRGGIGATLDYDCDLCKGTGSDPEALKLVREFRKAAFDDAMCVVNGALGHTTSFAACTRAPEWFGEQVHQQIECDRQRIRGRALGEAERVRQRIEVLQGTNAEGANEPEFSQYIGAEGWRRARDRSCSSELDPAGSILKNAVDPVQNEWIWILGIID